MLLFMLCWFDVSTDFMSSVHRPFRESITRPGGHQRTSLRAAAAGAARHSGPDTRLQVQNFRSFFFVAVITLICNH